MALVISILYRGPLTSCNYDCWYCPFAKDDGTPDRLEEDRLAMERFVRWVSLRDHPISVLFTPYGEGLIHSWYRSAMETLSHLPHVTRVAAQTNLSAAPDWLNSCNLDTLALWCSYHPSQVSQARFVTHCRMMDDLHVKYSVGCVGVREEIERIELLRRELSPEVYLWVNAYKHEVDYYTAEEVRRLETVDPLFQLNNRSYRSEGRPCRTGRSVISVQGDGTIHRCHFTREPLGSIYASDLESLLTDPPCPAPTCGCHIGYVNMNELGLGELFGTGRLERIPAEPFWQRPDVAEKTRRHVRLILQKEDKLYPAT